MKVIWLINLPLPQISSDMGEPSSNAGGWLVFLSKMISLQENIKLTILFPQNINRHLIRGVLESYCYYGFFSTFSIKKASLDELENVFESIVRTEEPDIVHIFGTEYLHTTAMINVMEKHNMISKALVTIQGLVSYCWMHYYAFLPNRIVSFPSFRDILKNDGIAHNCRMMKKQGEFEKASIEKIRYISGRTEWDKACVKQINPELIYLSINETLRENFYYREWQYTGRKTIFVSQAQYCLKGFHLVLKAVAILISQYPDLQVRVAGAHQKDKSCWKMTSYEKYIYKLIKNYHLESNIFFLGEQDANQMCTELENASVFVSASGIENSSNSVCEAMIVGTPVVSSDVGGTSSLINHGREGFLYPADEPYMMAHYIERLWNEREIAELFSSNSRKRARITHNPQTILYQVLEAYDLIAKGNKQ